MSNIKGQLSKLNLDKKKMKSGRNIEQEIKHHARILANCIQIELGLAYDSYEPKIYQRTFDLYNSIYVGDTEIKITATGASMSIHVGFDDGAMHNSLFGEGQVDTAILINEGFKTHGKFKNVPFFGYRPATHFIERGIERYKKQVSKPFAVRLTIGDAIREF